MSRLVLWLPVVHALFFGLLAGGWYLGRLGRWWISAMLSIWCASFLLLPLVAPGFLLFSGCVALLDVVLVLKVFQSDIPL